MAKESLFLTLNTDYTKPLNKSRTTAQKSACSYLKKENQQLSSEKKSKVNKQIETVNFFGYYAVNSVKIHSDYSHISSGNSPPKYILYKRLKIDIA
ncbi:hypothetical protein Pedsa_0588 [Pseudopedobacter saltans DSM 12145]|uniref:Uncharacterized protein n=1 Tax=Pseudopedobacter saltans (strain ATCC 51119 / DSM 12145 / JCM 21818 / CCUG 39354 / LMG 10337 / NBRC 100064 / NCIMB 13643) TaxID=762903 RepID=F0S7E2_PSESL|nr:hypothetical protein Pedsa_0588 [Pseudopedobacter saltans DSM 12145]